MKSPNEPRQPENKPEQPEPFPERLHEGMTPEEKDAFIIWALADSARKCNIPLPSEEEQNALYEEAKRNGGLYILD